MSKKLEVVSEEKKKSRKSEDKWVVVKDPQVVAQLGEADEKGEMIRVLRAATDLEPGEYRLAKLTPPFTVGQETVVKTKITGL